MIYIVRHGQTEWNCQKKLQGHNTVSLNKLGCDEAERISTLLGFLDITTIISSDLFRARETAEIINKNINKKIKYDKRLRSVNYGDLEGRVIEEISKEEWNIYNSTPKKINAESVEEVYKRIKDFFEELDVNDNILIITHGGVLRVIEYYIDNRQFFNNQIYCDFYKFKKQAKNTSVFEWDNDSKELRPLN